MGGYRHCCGQAGSQGGGVGGTEQWSQQLEASHHCFAAICCFAAFSTPGDFLRADSLASCCKLQPG